MPAAAEALAGLQQQIDSLTQRNEELLRRAQDAEQLALSTADGETLRRSEARFRALIEKSNDAISLTSAEGTTFYRSPAIAKMLGWSPEEMAGRIWSDSIFPDDLARFRNDVDGLVRRGERDLVLEFRAWHRDGSVHLMEGTATNLLDDPDVAAIVGNFRDVTPRKLAEQALKETRYLLEEAQVTAHVGSWTSGLGDGAEITWSAECYRIFGVPLGTAMSVEAFTACVFPADRDLVASASRHSVEHNLPYDIEHRVLRPDGQVCWVHERARVEHDNRGCPSRLLGTVQDVTQRHLAEENRARLAAIVESSEDAIVSTSLAGVITSWNHGAERLYGYSARDVIGKTIPALVPSGSAAEEEARILAGVARGDSIGAVETRRCRKDGSLVEVALTISPMRDRNGAVSGASAIARDLTARRATEATLLRTEEQFRQAQKMEAVGRLAGGVAHDFNNLLSVILGYTILALQDLTPGAVLYDDIQEIKTAAERAAALTRQLLAFSRQQILQPRVVDLAQIIMGMKAMLSRLIGEDIELSTSTTPELGRVLADPGQIEQVVMNLAVNARDAMPDGGKLTIELSNVQLAPTQASSPLGAVPGDYVMLAVSDTGMGMDLKTRARIFDPFFTTKEPGKGTGLGLSTVLGIVQQSGGNVSVYSELGAGTTFKVYLPRTDRALVAAPGSEPAITLGGTETILLVEDEEQVRVVASAILRRSGYQVLEASNGEEALLLLKDSSVKIELLLTDVVMPRMSGRKLAEQVARLRPALKLLFASGYTDDAVVRHGVLDAGVAFLQKPFTPHALLSKVRQVLDAPDPSH
jgi:PAS domain S-box-containing protein